MGQNNRVVYSTEHGRIAATMEQKSGHKKSGKGKGPNTSASGIRNPDKQGVRIRRESKGRGGKCVSVIDGLPLDGKGMKTLLKKLKGQLGTGGTVKDGCIEIQGDHREKLLLLLEQEGHRARLAGG
ncbi:MAG: translation initiation factor [Mariprofundaceae bacterium]|nr:translation initiation factor [Mariprofundaceae bacterium]